MLGGVATPVHDTGVYVFSHGKIRLVARSGTVIPGVGTVADLQNPFFVGADPQLLFGGAVINDPGQVAFQAILTDGRDALLIASPGGHHDDGDSGDDDSDGTTPSDDHDHGHGHGHDKSSDKSHDDEDVLHRSKDCVF
jgi:hypothetical protein